MSVRKFTPSSTSPYCCCCTLCQAPLWQALRPNTVERTPLPCCCVTCISLARFSPPPPPLLASVRIINGEIVSDDDPRVNASRRRPAAGSNSMAAAGGGSRGLEGAGYGRVATIHDPPASTPSDGRGARYVGACEPDICIAEAVCGNAFLVTITSLGWPSVAFGPPTSCRKGFFRLINKLHFRLS